MAAFYILLLLVCEVLLYSSAFVPRARANDDVLAVLGTQQKFRGTKKTLSNNVIIYKFLGIRYALAPTGSGRFDAPKPVPPFVGTVDSLIPGPECIQSAAPTVPDSEDCLFLNVHSPRLDGSLPVMVWVHGGAFHEGAGSRFDGSTLAAKGVVVVSINYRLGPFGFLSTGDDIMPGNYALMDQLLALKWVKKNIHAFGGDPNRITLFGESAGAGSIALHVLSPLSKGLFKRAIMHSGSFMCPWVVERPGTVVKLRDFAQGIGKILGCNNSTTSQLAECLRRSDARQLLLAAFNFRRTNNVDILSTPRVETKFGFLPDYPENMIDQGIFNQIDTMSGYNSGEWSSVVKDPDNDGITRAEFRANFDVVKHIYPAGGMDKVARVAENVYIANQTDPIEIRTQLVNVNTDLAFAGPLVFGLKKLSSRSDSTSRHYLFEFDYRKSSTTTPEWMGVWHASELELLFFRDDPNANPMDQQVANEMQAIWSNFAKTGDPSPTSGNPIHWQQFASDNLNMLKINKTCTMSTFPRPEAIQMFTAILPYFMGQSDGPSVIVG